MLMLISEVVIIFLLVVIGQVWLYSWSISVLASKAMTADGYELDVKGVYSLLQKRIISEKGKLVHPFRAVKVAKDFAHPLFYIFVVAILLYFIVGKLLYHFYGLPEFIPAIVGITPFYVVMNVLLKREKVKALDEIQMTRIETPLDFRHLGAYAKDVFHRDNSFENLRKAIKKRELGIEQYGEKYKRVYPKLDQNIDRITSNLKKLILTDELPEEFLKAKENYTSTFGVEEEVAPAEESETIQEELEIQPADKTELSAPHHIEVMKGIALDDELPDDLKLRAKRFVNEYDQREAERVKEARIKEALVHIETVEKYYDEQNRI